MLDAVITLIPVHIKDVLVAGYFTGLLFPVDSGAAVGAHKAVNVADLCAGILACHRRDIYKLCRLRNEILFTFPDIAELVLQMLFLVGKILEARLALRIFIFHLLESIKIFG